MGDKNSATIFSVLLKVTKRNGARGLGNPLLCNSSTVRKGIPKNGGENFVHQTLMCTPFLGRCLSGMTTWDMRTVVFLYPGLHYLEFGNIQQAFGMLSYQFTEGKYS